jgi:type VI secretion system secreted protein Hcp
MSREEANRIVRAVERARRSRRAALKVAIPTAAALGAGAAIAIGSIPSGDGTITGCYLTTVSNVDIQRYGQLRIIDPSQPATLPGGGPNDAARCESDEATISWNQRGPQGPQGPQGVQGAVGAQGPQGPAGRDLIGSTSFGFGGGGSTFLKLDGVKGEATDKFHKEDIAISSFSIGATSQHASGGGGGAGKVSFSSFTITKRIDKASPLLFRAAATGQHYKEATVFFAKAKRGKVADYLEYKMTNVFISSIQDGSAQGSGRPTEQISFNFAKIEEVFLGSNGKPTQSVSINVLQNKLS